MYKEIIDSYRKPVSPTSIFTMILAVFLFNLNLIHVLDKNIHNSSAESFVDAFGFILRGENLWSGFVATFVIANQLLLVFILYFLFSSLLKRWRNKSVVEILTLVIIPIYLIFRVLIEKGILGAAFSHWLTFPLTILGTVYLVDSYRNPNLEFESVVRENRLKKHLAKLLEASNSGDKTLCVIDDLIKCAEAEIKKASSFPLIPTYLGPVLVLFLGFLIKLFADYNLNFRPAPSLIVALIPLTLCMITLINYVRKAFTREKILLQSFISDLNKIRLEVAVNGTIIPDKKTTPNDNNIQ